MPRWDFWLFDDTDLWTLRYDDDGRWLGVTRSSAPAELVEARRARDAAMAGAILWAEFMHQHPDLAARVPGGVAHA